MIFLGIEVNTILFTLTIPVHKLHEILQVLQEWKNKKAATLKETQKLAGLLNFASRCIKSGRIYLFRILNFLRSLPPSGSCAIDIETKLDIEWWIKFAPKFDGVTLMLENKWSEPDEFIESDSCLMGGGVCMQNQFFHIEFPHWVKSMCSHINQLECIVVVVALQKWARCFPRKKIQISVIIP